MILWPKQPVIYEINTWVWLHHLSRRYQRPITLETVPQEEWEAVGKMGIDAVWLMGVWERSPEGVRIARESPGLEIAYRKVLTDYSREDVVGSPYAVHRYVVDENLGGREGLAHARFTLAQLGMLLILDFVPNHMARDHPWVLEHAEYFIQGNADDLRREPESFFSTGDKIIACGKDPFFPPWTDTAQMNAFSPGMRIAAIEALRGISGQCDGVRCDMTMLLINRVFEETWGERAGPHPESEYWRETIQAIRRIRPDFLFLGEAYWDLEWELQQQGFNYCYDTRLYDRLVGGAAGGVRLHLQADASYQDKLVRFIENHDEPRAASIFPPRKLRAAALVALSLPGAKLLQEGQLEGKRVKMPVQLGRCPEEEADEELEKFYHRLLQVIRAARIRDAEWRLCVLSGWPDNQSYLNLQAWSWSGPKDPLVIAVNLSDEGAQGRVRLPWQDLAGHFLRLTDLLSGAEYLRDGNEMLDPGLYVDLKAWGFHFLSLAANA